MSNFKYAFRELKIIIEDLKTLTEEDLIWQNMAPISDVAAAYKRMGTLYIKYILITNSFSKLMDMVVLYSKRERLKPILANLFSRIIELKLEIAKLMKTDVPYLDNIFMEMKITRRDIEIKVPIVYRMERALVVKEFYQFTEKIQNGLILKMPPNKPVPELTFDLKKYFEASIMANDLINREKEGQRIQAKDELVTKLGDVMDKSIPQMKRLHVLKTKNAGNLETQKIIKTMGFKREKVYKAMRVTVSNPLDVPYESWKYTFARDVVRAPYFEGKHYFHGYDKLVSVSMYGKFITSIALIQMHERARLGCIYYMILKERHEKIFVILMNRRKGLKTVLKSKDDFKYPVVFRDYSALERNNSTQATTSVNQVNVALQLYGLIPGPILSSDFCSKYNEHRSIIRKKLQCRFEQTIKAELVSDEEFSRYRNLKELDVIEEILNYFKEWHQASKPLAAKFGWDLLDIPNPDKPILPPPAYVVGIPKALTDAFVEQNFEKLTNIPQRPPPLAGSALIVSGNHIAKGQYMAIKPLGLARQGMSKEAKEAELKKAKDKKEAQSSKKKGDDKGYKPFKSEIPLFVLQRTRDLKMSQYYEESEMHSLQNPKTIDEEDVNWKISNRINLKLRLDVDKKMVTFQKSVRLKMIKKHRKAENLKKRNLPAMKKPKKEKMLSEVEKWNAIYALTKDGYFKNYGNYLVENMPGHHIYSFANYEWIEEYFTEPEPAWGDLYQLVKLWCILPLLDINIRQYGPLISSIAFVGPHNVIYRLVSSVAHESGAVLIHIHPLRPVGDIPLTQLANIIIKIATAAQPTIIWVEDCHFLFMKKEKDLPLDKSPFTTIVQKIKKLINRKFRAIMIGTTDKPQIVNGKRMSKIFDRIIPFPYKDYHSSADYWGKTIFRKSAVAKSFPYPALTEPTKSYLDSQLTRLFSETVMTPERTKTLIVKPLKIEEYVIPLKKAKEIETTDENIKIDTSAFVWANKQYNTFKLRKKLLKDKFNERLGATKTGMKKKP